HRRCRCRVVSHKRLFSACDGGRLDLHPFPTRRSSDLRGRQAGEQQGEEQNRPAANAQLQQPLLPLIWWDPGDVHEEEAAVAAGRDRKSTRLNSSHVKISYAVFCLKKKTKHNADTLAPA